MSKKSNFFESEEDGYVLDKYENEEPPADHQILIEGEIDL